MHGSWGSPDSPRGCLCVSLYPFLYANEKNCLKGHVLHQCKPRARHASQNDGRNAEGAVKPMGNK